MRTAYIYVQGHISQISIADFLKEYILHRQYTVKSLNRPPPLIDNSPISIALFVCQMIARSDILKQTTSLNDPFKVGPMVGQFRMVLL